MSDLADNSGFALSPLDIATYTVRLTALVRSRLSARYRARLDADDVVASAWRSYFSGERSRRWKTSTTDLWPLLAMIAHRKLLKGVRRHRASSRDLLQEETLWGDLEEHARSDAPTNCDVVEATETLENLLDSLGPIEREVVLLRLKGQNPEQVADSLCTPLRTVERAYSRAVSALRERLSDEDFDWRQIDLQELLSDDGPADPPPVEPPVPVVPFSDLLMRRMVGQGGISRIYHAESRKTGRIVAVKFLRKRFWKDPRALVSLSRELVAISRIAHEAVLRPHGMGRTPSGTPFLVMDLAPGVPLSSLISQGPLDVRTAMIILRRIAEALVAAHAEGVVHGDVTPSNIVISSGEKGAVLTDFGFATVSKVAGVLRGGTAGFAAPEQWSDVFGDVGPWTDVYGIAATAVAVLSGQSPQIGATRAEVIASALCGIQKTAQRLLSPQVPVSLKEALINCLASEIPRRPQSMNWVLQKFNEISMSF